MTTSAELLSCRGLACGYHDRAVLSGVDLTMRPGEVVVLLGPNGSGKSTLLKTVARTLPIVAGEVRLGDRSIGSYSFGDLARSVAFVPQEEQAPFAFTVRQVVVMGRLPHSGGLLDTPEDHQIAEESMREADCLHLAERPLLEISGGERQRALIARALAQRARLLLLDEPNAHLDVRHQGLVVRLLRRMAEEGKGVLTAIHDLNLASLMADRAIVLGEGKVLAVGETQSVLRSEAVDTAYGVGFHRMEADDGRVRMFPRL